MKRYQQITGWISRHLLPSKRKTRLWIAGVIISMGLLVLYADHTVRNHAAARLYGDATQIPAHYCGLLLGTAKKLRNGNDNPYYTYRIAAAVTLYQAGKIQRVVVSGDNRRKDYNEPEDMQKDLVAAGIPDSAITLDYAGLRTYDSVYRMRAIFGQSDFTVISQAFHNERALYIAQGLGMDAHGFNAKDVSRAFGFKVMAREKLARVKVLLDVLFRIKPRHLGEKVEIQ
jgi:SanA protein